MSDFSLPSGFLRDMQNLLGTEFPDFAASFDKERFCGLRLNPLKCKNAEIPGDFPFSLEKVPWANEGYYYNAGDRPGRHPLHFAGLYYIQEPSAMAPVSVLDPKPGDYVLDLCAAPGGKSTQAAGRLLNKGLLVSNEINRTRASILSENVERMGIRNAVVLNESPAALKGRFDSFFDKIIVDAPCSGEGMFRKEEAAVTEWSEENVKTCIERQAEILDCAASMLKAGGRLVYSTCTFNPGENEGTIIAFLSRHPEFKLVSSPLASFFAKGRPEWANNDPALSDTMRLWPHKLKGEGHFVALLEKSGEKSEGYTVKKTADKNLTKDLRLLFTKEMKIRPEAADELLEGTVPVEFGENIYLLPESFPDLKGLKVLRPGLHVAVKKKDRLEPAHALAVSLKPCELTEWADLSEEEALKYLCGETVSCSPELKGWLSVMTHGFSMGLGKASGGIIKNHYPKGLRIQK